MIKRIASVFVVFALVGSHNETRASESRQEELFRLSEAYIANVFAAPHRTLREHYQFESPSTEYEERFIVACERHDPLPRSLREACAKRLKNRDSEHVPSMYLRWLRNKLPVPPHRVAIVGLRRVNPGTPFEGDQIEIDVNGVSLKFFRARERTSTGPELGRFSLVSIAGIPISKLIHDDLAAARKGLSP
jgi:hypothetical protein